MKILKTTSSLLMLFLALNINAQDIANQSGVMNATVTHTFGYEKEGVQRPYTVTIHEKRVSTIRFDKADIGKENQDRIPTPENVAILIAIKNPNNSSDNRVIALRYSKTVNDTFSIEPISTGFVVSVSERKMKYTIGEGVSFNNPEDKNYFDIDEFDVVK